MSQPTPGVASAIAAAAQLTGVSARYLTTAAQRESAFDPAAQAATSSAAGLFQFIESTWLSTLERHGGRLGLDDHAQLGREEALALRFDPKLSALLAGALTAENADALSKRLGREPTEGELYAAHVLGAGGASRLIETAAVDPDGPAASLLPEAARANRGLFYANGEPVPAAVLLEKFITMMGPAGASPAAADGDDAGLAQDQGAAWRAPPGPAPLHLTATTIALLAALDPPERADSAEPQAKSRDGAEEPRG